MGGYGGDSCGLWTKQRRDLHSPLTMGQMAWVLGYLSGINLWEMKKDFLKGRDTESVFGWIDKHCEEKPLHTLAEAVFELAVVMHK